MWRLLRVGLCLRPAVSRVVTIVTPVVKAPSALRNSRASIPLISSGAPMASTQRRRRDRHVAEGTAVGAWFGRQAQRPLCQDVAQHLVGAAFEPVDRTEAEHAVELLHLVVLDREAACAEQVEPERRDRLRGARTDELAHRHLGAGLLAALERAQDAVDAEAH